MYQRTKNGIIKFTLVVVIVFIYFIFQVNKASKAIENDRDYYKITNLKFNGIINKIKPLKNYGHDYGVILIDINSSNKKQYDPRDSLDRFLGIVKNKKADLVFDRIGEIKIGDSIDFNVQEYRIYRNGKMIDEGIVGMPFDDVFKPFKDVNKNIEL